MQLNEAINQATTKQKSKTFIKAGTMERVLWELKQMKHYYGNITINALLNPASMANTEPDDRKPQWSNN